MDGEVDRGGEGGGFRGGTGGLRVELGEGSGSGNVATEENAVGTLLLVEKLQWWTTDEQLESEAAKYGNVKEVKFFEVTESGKSSGQCHIEFYDPASAAACKVWMNGHLFNEKPCAVNFASPCSLRRMEAQVIRNQECWKRGRDRRPRTRGPIVAPYADPAFFGRGMPMSSIGKMPGTVGGPIMGMWAGSAGSGFGQGIGAAPPPMYPNSMMGYGFNPASGGPMGFPGVAPYENPAFFGRGMQMIGIGMVPGNVGGPNMGMWAGSGMGGWGGGRASYGEEAAASDHQYGEVSHDRGAYDRRYCEDRDSGYDRDMPRERDVVGRQDHDWSERKRRDDGRERDRVLERDRQHSRDRERQRDRDHRDRDRHRCRDDRDRSDDHHHRYRDCDGEHGEDRDRGRSSKTRSKSRSSQPSADDLRSRSRDSDHEKR